MICVLGEWKYLIKLNYSMRNCAENMLFSEPVYHLYKKCGRNTPATLELLSIVMPAFAGLSAPICALSRPR